MITCSYSYVTATPRLKVRSTGLTAEKDPEITSEIGDQVGTVSKATAMEDSNTKRFKRTLIYFNPDTQYAHF